MTQVKAVTFVCTLSPSPIESSSDKIARDIDEELKKYDVAHTIIRAVDHDILPGVEADMGKGDDWPTLRKKVLAADIVIISTPTWLGQMSSVAMRILERLDAEISIEDDDGRPCMFGKVAGVAVVGNEDGAHKISADLFQALNDVGFTIPAQAVTYWNDEAMGSRDYKDLEEIPDATACTTEMVARNTVHLAKLLRAAQYPV